MLGNLFKRIDLFFLKKFQWCSDKIFDFFGIGNFQVAKLLMGVYCGLLIWDCSIGFSLLKFRGNSSVGTLLLYLVPLIVLFLWWKVIISAAEKITENTPAGSLSPAVLFFIFLRSYKIFLLLIGLGHLFTAINILSDDTWPLPVHYYGLYNLCDYLERIVSFCILYFASCQPKPPQTSKLKALLDKYKIVRRPAFST